MAVDPNLIAEFFDENGHIVFRVLRDGTSTRKVVLQPSLPSGPPQAFARAIFYRLPRGTIEFSGRFAGSYDYTPSNRSLTLGFQFRSFLSDARAANKNFLCDISVPFSLDNFFGPTGLQITQLVLRNDDAPEANYANWIRTNLSSSILDSLKVAHSTSARTRDPGNDRAPAGGLRKALLQNLKDVDLGLRESKRGPNDVPQPLADPQPDAFQYVDVGFRKITLRHSDGATYDRMVFASGTTIHSKPGRSGTFDLRLADGVAVNVPVDGGHPIRVELYQDPHSDNAEAPASRATNWYLEMSGVPGHALCAIWNRWVAEPYLAALRTVVDGDDLTLLPRLSALDDRGPENAERYKLLFRVKNADVDSDQWGIPEFVGIKLIFSRAMLVEKLRKLPMIEVRTGSGGLRNHIGDQWGIVLFADISGFTTMTEQLWLAKKDVLTQALIRFYDTCIEVVQSRGGVVDKFIGDEVMAIFFENEKGRRSAAADRAIGAALELSAKFESLALQFHEGLADQAEQWTKVVWQLKVGLEAGSMRIVDKEISLGEKEFCTIGHAVNLAARIKGVAGGHAVTIGPTLKFVATGRYNFKEIDIPAHLKNVSAEIPIFVVDKSFGSGPGTAVSRRSK